MATARSRSVPNKQDLLGESSCLKYFVGAKLSAYLPRLWHGLSTMIISSPTRQSRGSRAVTNEASVKKETLICDPGGTQETYGSFRPNNLPIYMNSEYLSVNYFLVKNRLK